MAVILTCGVFIIDEDNNLLIMKPSGDNNYAPWSIPKGQKDEKEKPIDTALREVFEETQISLDKERMVDTDAEYLYRNKKKKLHSFVYQLRKYEERPKVVLDWENSEYKWMPLKDAYNLVHEAQRFVLWQMMIMRGIKYV